jgi:hypothetical protein
MNPYLLAGIAVPAIAFLLYCLLNFARELKRRKSSAVLSYGWSRPNAPVLYHSPSTQAGPQIVRFRGQRRTAS